MRQRFRVLFITVLCIVLVVVTVIGTIELMKINGFYITSTAYANDQKPFTEIYNGNNNTYYIMMDNHNGVMYAISKKSGTWIVMVNNDGSPRIYEHWHDVNVP